MIDLEKLLELLSLDAKINLKKLRYIKDHPYSLALVNTLRFNHKVEEGAELTF